MNLNNILIAAAAAGAVLLIVKAYQSAPGANYTTAGERIILGYKNGLIVDQKGRVWL